MNLLWQEGKPMTSLELFPLTEGTGWSINYVQKMLSSLTDSGYVEICGVVRKGKHYVRKFQTCLTKEEYVAEMIEKQNLGTASLAKLAVTLVKKSASRKTSRVSDELIEQLEKMIDEYENSDEGS